MRGSLRALISTALAAAMIAGPVVAKIAPGAAPRARLAKIRRLQVAQCSHDVTSSDVALHNASECYVARASYEAALAETRSSSADEPNLVVRCFDATSFCFSKAAAPVCRSSSGSQFSPGFNSMRC
jgi:hypothetical protein